MNHLRRSSSKREKKNDSPQTAQRCLQKRGQNLHINCVPFHLRFLCHPLSPPFTRLSPFLCYFIFLLLFYYFFLFKYLLSSSFYKFLSLWHVSIFHFPIPPSLPPPLLSPFPSPPPPPPRLSIILSHSPSPSYHHHHYYLLPFAASLHYLPLPPSLPYQDEK